MICPICSKPSNIKHPGWGYLLRCPKCGCLSHPDNWIYTDSEWKKLHPAEDKS